LISVDGGVYGPGIMGARWIFALVAALALMACGGSEKKYMLPVDSPAKPFIAPEADELVESDGDAWSVDEDEDEGEADADDTADADTTPPATPPKPAPQTKPAVAPAKPAKPAKPVKKP
jgi:outer membrane biosynthesis protein TonB